MKIYNGSAIINENFNDPILITGIEANNENEAIDKMTELVYERRNDVDKDSDTVDIDSLNYTIKFDDCAFNDLQDIAIPIVNEMVKQGLIKDCADTDDQDECYAQDIISEHLAKVFGLDWDKINE